MYLWKDRKAETNKERIDGRETLKETKTKIMMAMRNEIRRSLKDSHSQRFLAITGYPN